MASEKLKRAEADMIAARRALKKFEALPSKKQLPDEYGRLLNNLAGAVDQYLALSFNESQAPQRKNRNVKTLRPKQR